MVLLFTLQIIIALLLIIVVMLQSSDEDALSGIGASAGNSGILSHSSSTDAITKITIWLGVFLIANSLALVMVSKRDFYKSNNIVKDYIEKQNKEEKKELPEETETKVEEVKESENK